MATTVFQKGARGLRRVSLLLAKAEMMAAQTLIVVFTCLILFNVFRRYAFNRPLYFAEELSVYILIWMAFLAIAVTIARMETIRLTFIVDALPSGLRLLTAILVEALVALMLAAMTWAAWTWFYNPAIAFERAITLGQPKWPYLMVIPLFCTAACFHVIANLVDLIANGDKWGDEKGDERAAS